MRLFQSKSARAVAVIISSALIVLFFTAGLVSYTNLAVLKTEARTEAKSWSGFLNLEIEGLATGLQVPLTGEQKVRLSRRVQNIAGLSDARVFDGQGVQQFAWTGEEENHRSRNGGYQKSKLRLALAGRTLAEIDRRTNGDQEKFYIANYFPIVADGKVIGAWHIRADRTEKAAALEKTFGFLASMLVLFVFWIAIALGVIFVSRIQKQEAIEREARYLAHHDEVTGLYKRERFAEKLEECMSPSSDKSGTALYIIDINGFSDINDSLGRAAGDALLKQIADDIKCTKNESDFAARIGGDEFAVLRTCATDAEETEEFARQLTSTFKRPHEFNGTALTVAVSVGVKFCSTENLSADDFMKAAKLAMSGARAKLGTNYCIHTPELEAELVEKEQIARDLRLAIRDKSQFQLHYQPQFHLSTGRLDGYETLIRWNHPTKGMISPADFVPIAEASGLICDLGAWVLEKACSDAASWEEDIRVAVNISPLQIKNDDMIARVSKTLAKCSLPPERLELEVTESLFFDEPEKTIQTLTALKQMGVSISMDDFGTGFSCLKHLWQFPFDKIKIDKSFVDNIQENPKVESIIASTVQLGRMLGMKITAEGVETKEQAEFLNGLDCDFVQGFLYGKPMPVKDTGNEILHTTAVEQLREIIRKAELQVKPPEVTEESAEEFVARIFAAAV